MSLSLRVGKSSVHPGDTEIVSISAVDKNSSKPITASVSGNISSSGFLKKFRGSTDSSGKASYSWKVSSGDKIGKYRVIAQIYSPDYESESASKTFKVSPLPIIISNPTYTNYHSFTSTSHVTNNGSNNNNNTSNGAQINNSKNKNLRNHPSIINPDQLFGVPITHVPFVIP